MAKKRNCLSRVSQAIVTSLEEVFFRYGRSIATHPFIYITVCVVVTIVCCLGFANFYSETRPEKLWIPQDSDFVKTVEWQTENFPSDTRAELALFEADNVLTAENIKRIYEIRKSISELTVTENGTTYYQEDLCFEIFGKCLENGILDIWGPDNETLIESLTDDQIIIDINSRDVSATFRFPVNFTNFLGDVEYDESGQIIGAKATIYTWIMKINREELVEGFMEEVDAELFAWEGEFDTFMKGIQEEEEYQGLTVYYNSARSFGEIAGDTILGDVFFMVIGCLILFVYVCIMLGRFNWVETRPILSLLGLLSIFMAIGLSFGLCSAFGVPFGPVHSVLPLLMLGLGVDDMFIIVQCFKNLNVKERKDKLNERMGYTMRHAGVAITVTSMTDFLAFAIGASTVLPALQSFCIYCAVGIIALYLLQATFFVACFSLDQKRLEADRNGILCCIKHKNYKPNKCSQNDMLQLFFEKVYSKFILKKPVKVCILIFTAGLLAVNIWGVTTLEQKFDPLWFLPPSSYLFQFFDQTKTYFPSDGDAGQVYMGNLTYHKELPNISNLTIAMRENEYISSVDSWYDLLCEYSINKESEDITGIALNDTFFNKIMNGFLFSETGGRYQSYFQFDGELLTFSGTIPPIIASKFDYRHIILDDKESQQNAMDQIKQMVDEANFSDFAAAISPNYANWETDKIISYELYRNLGLSMLAVLLMTLLLLANIVASFYVLICVVMTLVDVMALMAFWGLTIDTVSCINLVVSVGLCVDYSVHIALHFLQVSGTRDERVARTIAEMGTPVVNGAFSTFLAFVLLATSESHVFESFFKIFFGVFIYGVYHGLVFLPVVLSLIGPAPYRKDDPLLGQDSPDGSQMAIYVTNTEKTTEKPVQIEGRQFTQSH